MSRQEFGDWQTPAELAESALKLVAKLMSSSPAVVLEPTCGRGAFLGAASKQFATANLVGYELNDEYVHTARAALPAARSIVRAADFFCVNWDQELAALPEPILITGNPPWVTNSILGVLGSENLPQKRNFKKLAGLEALTGKSNFDVSEWMLLRLLGAMQNRRCTVAVLCKTAVARRVIEFAGIHGWGLEPGGLWRIDAQRHFGAAVDAVLFVCEIGNRKAKSNRWPVYSAIEAGAPESEMALFDGVLTANAGSVARTEHLEGICAPEWRSGLKHDCSKVMELVLVDGAWQNGLGQRVEIEDELVFPLLKSSDVANGRLDRGLGVVVPQRRIGDDTSILKQRSPKAWDYLTTYRDLLSARKSSIYRSQPPFAIFGIGPYSFAPWKVAISGLYKRLEFRLIGPQRGKPVMLDDTCYFLPFESEATARKAWVALQSPVAQDFFAGRVFWDAKRPISKVLLQKLDLHALKVELKLEDSPQKGRQLGLAF